MPMNHIHLKSIFFYVHSKLPDLERNMLVFNILINVLSTADGQAYIFGGLELELKHFSSQFLFRRRAKSFKHYFSNSFESQNWSLNLFREPNNLINKL